MWNDYHQARKTAPHKVLKTGFATKKLQLYLESCNIFVTFAPSLRQRVLLYMTHNDLFKRLKRAGCSIIRHGARHDIWYSPVTGKSRPMPRHGAKEVPTGLLKSIEKELLGL